MTDALDVFGTLEPLPGRRTLRAGPLAAVLEGGQLREVTWAGVLVLRGIAWLARDEGWGTPPLALSGLRAEEDGQGFDLSWRIALDAPMGALDAEARLVGRAEGRLRFEVAAEVVRDLRTSRLGFVVLHPDTAAGLPLTLTHTDGREEATTFPLLIRQDQPAMDLRALAHAPAPGLQARVTFEGDPFEMEDQRNWSDASFKTYVRPVAWPRPYVLPAGHEDRQSVTLDLEGEPGGPAAVPALPRGPRVAAVPDLWLRLDEREPVPASLPLRGLAHGLIVRVSGPDRPRLLAAAALAGREGMALAVEAVVPLRDPEAEAASLLAAMGGLPVAALLAAGERDRRTRPPGRDPAGEAPLASLVAALRRGFAGPVGAGTPAFFTEFNRNPPPPADMAFFGSCATVHAADDASVMETAGVLPAILDSAAALVPGAPLWPGPLAIAPTIAPYAPALAESDGATRTPMAARDPRHGALFGAAHLVAVLAALAGRAPAAAPLMASGPCGVAGPGGAPLPLAFVHAAVAGARSAPLDAPEGGLEGGPDLIRLGWGGPEPGCLFANPRAGPVAVSAPPAAGQLLVLHPGARGWALEASRPTFELGAFGVAWWRGEPGRGPRPQGGFGGR